MSQPYRPSTHPDTSIPQIEQYESQILKSILQIRRDDVRFTEDTNLIAEETPSSQQMNHLYRVASIIPHEDMHDTSFPSIMIPRGKSMNFSSSQMLSNSLDGKLSSYSAASIGTIPENNIHFNPWFDDKIQGHLHSQLSQSDSEIMKQYSTFVSSAMNMNTPLASNFWLEHSQSLNNSLSQFSSHSLNLDDSITFASLHAKNNDLIVPLAKRKRKNRLQKSKHKSPPQHLGSISPILSQPEEQDDVNKDPDYIPNQKSSSRTLPSTLVKQSRKIHNDESISSSPQPLLLRPSSDPNPPIDFISNVLQYLQTFLVCNTPDSLATCFESEQLHTNLPQVKLDASDSNFPLIPSSISMPHFSLSQCFSILFPKSQLSSESRQFFLSQSYDFSKVFDGLFTGGFYCKNSKIHRIASSTQQPSSCIIFKTKSGLVDAKSLMKLIESIETRPSHISLSKAPFLIVPIIDQMEESDEIMSHIKSQQISSARKKRVKLDPDTKSFPKSFNKLSPPSNDFFVGLEWCSLHEDIS